MGKNNINKENIQTSFTYCTTMLLGFNPVLGFRKLASNNCSVIE